MDIQDQAVDVSGDESREEIKIDLDSIREGLRQEPMTQVCHSNF